MPEIDPASPARTCVGCRSRAEKTQLLRVVVVEDACIPDDRGRLPGRGAYLHRERRCLDLAEKRRAFPRAFRVPGPLDISALTARLPDDPPQDQHHPGATAAGPDTRAGR